MQISKDIEQMKKDIDLIKSLLLPKVDDEGELNDWAKIELKRTRNTPDSECVSFEEVKKRLKNKR